MPYDRARADRQNVRPASPAAGVSYDRRQTRLRSAGPAPAVVAVDARLRRGTPA
ncbi:hypothetical protein [Pseudonocardia sp. D17]|uniref:hypothetical protein n=1 Tax=Pseudonocardia sp. D17 TaxID=882661 RepID=UPI0030D09D25